MTRGGLDASQETLRQRGEALSARGRKVRLQGLFVVALLWTGLLVWRLASLQIFQQATWQEWAEKQHITEVKLASERGPVFDRNGQILAVSVPAGSIYVRPRVVKEKKDAAKLISSILGSRYEEVLEKLESTRPFVWVERQVPRAKAEAIEGLGLKGVGYMPESRRVYPFNEAGSTVIGRVGIDGNGLSGIEQTYERYLTTAGVTKVAARDALGNIIHTAQDTEGEFTLPKGNSLSLTIDSAFQIILDEELEKGQREARAKAAFGVLVDAETGDILGLGQSPAFDFNQNNLAIKGALKNLVAEMVFEPGSIMKPLVAGAALQERVVGFRELLDCEHGRYVYASHAIRDHHPSDLISFREVVVRSSNIGMAKVGDRLGRERLYQYLQAFGFGQKTKVGLPGESRGILRSSDSWAKVDVATHSFGQGVSVTPLQIVRAVSAVANGGVLPVLHLIKGRESDMVPQRVLKPEIATLVQDMMFGVVEEEKGTGHSAAIPNVRIAGKTGTAQKANPTGRGYAQHKYVSSFVGFADASSLGISQKLVLFVAMDEPAGAAYYGSQVAAPVFRRSMQRILHEIATRHEYSGGGLAAKGKESSVG